RRSAMSRWRDAVERWAGVDRPPAGPVADGGRPGSAPSPVSSFRHAADGRDVAAPENKIPAGPGGVEWGYVGAAGPSEDGLPGWLIEQREEQAREVMAGYHALIDTFGDEGQSLFGVDYQAGGYPWRDVPSVAERLFPGGALVGVERFTV